LKSADQEDLLEGFRSVSTASISDVTGQKYAFSHNIRPLIPGIKVAGRAVTVRTEPGDPGKPTEAVGIATKGDIIVIDARGSEESACWGGNDSIGSKVKGLSAVIVDGAIRDTAEIMDMHFPTWCRAVTPRVGGEKRGGEINVPITCGGVRVNPGDVIMADDDGIVVIPSEEAAEVLEKSIEREALEKGIKAKVLEGLTLAEAGYAMHLPE
jgi:3-hexulose-6-phosphate synthase/6-phospho-3-hexuloisomerase